MRIARYLARCGIGSRRQCEDIIRAGRVALDGDPVLDLGRQVDLGAQVSVDGKPVVYTETALTLAVYKPTKVVVTRSDPQQRTTIYDILDEQYRDRSAELVYAGRLDYASEGLLILTTDGELANRLTHPRHHVEKEYHVRVNRELKPEELEKLRQGVDLGDHETSPSQVDRLYNSLDLHRYRVVIHEGRNRQVRRMMESVGVRTIELCRVRIGGLHLDELKLKKGEMRELDAEAIDSIFSR